MSLALWVSSLQLGLLLLRVQLLCARRLRGCCQSFLVLMEMDCLLAQTWFWMKG